MFKFNIAIIGTGRVGLPLGLSLCNTGLEVIGIDKNIELIEKVNKKVMPFNETGCDELIKQVDFKIFSDFSKVADCETLIITVGTPLNMHIETDLSQINQVIMSICPYIKKGHNIILRSTVAPKTTEYVKRVLEKETKFTVGIDIFLSFCPERLAEGKALQELKTLPQIIGCQDDESYKKSEGIFLRLTSETLKTDYISAELVKLFNNTSRYIHFAMANQFTVIAETYGVNSFEVIEMSNYKYPRGIIPKPGFTAGTCLRKDFGMLNESSPYMDLLISSWKINEYLPKFIVDQALLKTDLFNKNIAILGYTFKADTDDCRDSLVPKLIRYIMREVPHQIKIHDPYLPATFDRFVNYSIESTLSDADIIFFATNHSLFDLNAIKELSRNSAYFVDIWNMNQTNKLIYQWEELR